MNLAFVRHQSAQDAQPVIDAIRTAKKQGRPFQVMFFESGSVIGEEYWLSEFKARQKTNAQIIDLYKKLTAKGANDHEARQFIEGELAKNPGWYQFTARVHVECALQGIPIIPMEMYSAAEFQEFQRIGKRIDSITNRIDNLLQSGTNLVLLQQAPASFNSFKIYAHKSFH